MEDEKLKSFSLTALFFVTGISSFIFYVLMKLLDGTESVFFVWIGLAGLGTGMIIYMLQTMRPGSRKHKKRIRRPQ